jgi:hypothetical protein
MKLLFGSFIAFRIKESKNNENAKGGGSEVKNTLKNGRHLSLIRQGLFISKIYNPDFILQ